MKALVVTIVVAAVLWTVMFCPITAPHVPFWWMMTASAAVLCLLSAWANRGWWQQITLSPQQVATGVAIAAVLWCVFWAGDKLSSLLLGFARGQVDAIYLMKQGHNPWLLTILMLTIIGPAEEIYWRGYVQRTLMGRWGANAGWVAATLIYGLIHAGSCNFMLVMAAMVAGAVWGAIYRWCPQSLGALIVSHAVWDVAVFVWLPI